LLGQVPNWYLSCLGQCFAWRVIVTYADRM